MRILFVAPLPPPVHGQALASAVFLQNVERRHALIKVDTAKDRGGRRKAGMRIIEIAGILFQILKHSPKSDLVYLTISESRAGNLKDLLIYILCWRRLDRMFIHLHGGASMARLMKKKIIGRVNAFFLKRLRGIIVLGNTHRKIFEEHIGSRRIHVVPNFAEDYLFCSQDEVVRKHCGMDPMNILFLSNFLQGKGYVELLDAYRSLADELKAKIRINFAGAFPSEVLRSEFLHGIRGIHNIHYHGVVEGQAKRKLFEQSHVFCLPTYYPYEGQPISILEAYAAGCAVITTNHSGIRDVFSDKKNGYQVEKRSSDSIESVLKNLLHYPEQLLPIGLFNRWIAEKRYRTTIYNESLQSIMRL